MCSYNNSVDCQPEFRESLKNKTRPRIDQRLRRLEEGDLKGQIIEAVRHSLNDLWGQNWCQIRTERSRLPYVPPGIDFGGCRCNLIFFKSARSMTTEVKTGARFRLSGPDFDFEGCRCNLNFKGRKATASMTSEVKTKARFRLGALDCPQVPILKAIDAVWILKASSPRGPDQGRVQTHWLKLPTTPSFRGFVPVEAFEKLVFYWKKQKSDNTS